ncbi:hypothetical protein RIF29_34014 [Crotalaria pallida]|uniref:Uncharacterized protein n=1 Tax=Crotalaria pallida TaxID=3830 RepID=A0AAN9E9P3_CROPI
MDLDDGFVSDNDGAAYEADNGVAADEADNGVAVDGFVVENEQVNEAVADENDDQKGLESVFEELLDGVEHRYCLRHLYNNFKKQISGGTDLRDIMMGAAKATTEQQWKSKMMEMKDKTEAGYNWLMRTCSVQGAAKGNEEATNATAYTPIESSFVPSEGNGEAADVTAYTPIESSFVPSESATVATNAKTEMPKVSKTKRGKRPRVASGESSKASIDPKEKRVNGPKMDTTEPMESAPRTYDQILNLLTEPEIANMVKALSSTYDMMRSILRPISPKSPVASASAFESVEGSDDDEDVADNSQLDTTFLHTNGDVVSLWWLANMTLEIQKAMCISSASAFESVEGSNDDEDVADNSQLDTTFLHTNRDVGPEGQNRY